MYIIDLPLRSFSEINSNTSHVHHHLDNNKSMLYFKTIFLLRNYHVSQNPCGIKSNSPLLCPTERHRIKSKRITLSTLPSISCLTWIVWALNCSEAQSRMKASWLLTGSQLGWKFGQPIKSLRSTELPAQWIALRRPPMGWCVCTLLIGWAAAALRWLNQLSGMFCAVNRGK